MNDSVKFSRSPIERIWRGLPSNIARATITNASALNAISRGAPRCGNRKPARAGPTIVETFNCTPPSVTAEDSSSLLTMSGTIAPQTGAPSASPIPSAKMQASKELALTTCVRAPRARSAAHAPCHRTALAITKRRSPMSASTPAGSVKRKNGAEAAVAIRERENDEAPRSCINQVAAMSCAETAVPDNTLARNKRQKTGFRSANQVEVDFISWRAM